MARQTNGGATLPARQEAQPPATTTKGGIMAMLENSRDRIREVLPAHLTPERVIRITAAALARKSEVRKCSELSILNCVMQASQLGLELDSPLGHAYMVPYGTEATFQLGYKGMAELARRSGYYRLVEVRAVYARDVFTLEYLPEANFRHVPYTGSEAPGEITHVYAYARTTGGDLIFEIMTAEQVDKIRAGSVSKNSPAWSGHWGEMAKKVVLKRFLKRQPCSIEMADAIDIDNRVNALVDRIVDRIAASPKGTAGLKHRLSVGVAPEPEFRASEGVPNPVYSEADEPSDDLPEDIDEPSDVNSTEGGRAG